MNYGIRCELKFHLQVLLNVNYVKRIIGNAVEKVRGNSLKAKAARGSLILAIGTFAERGLRLVCNMILARLLAPEDFGLMAIVLSVLIVLESFTDIGVRQSIIHHKSGDKAEYLNIAWWVQVTRGLILFIIAALWIAPLICQFYGKPELLDLLRVSLLVVVFNGLSSPRLYLLDKELRFVKAVMLGQGSSLLGTLVSIVLALYLKNVWVLVIGRVVQSGMRCLLSHIMCPFRPRLKINRPCLKEFLKFGRGMVGLAFLTVVSMQTDVFVLGKLLPSEEVGMYALALSLARLPVYVFARTVGRVLLPVFAEKQDDRKAICIAVLKILKSTFLLGVPIVVIMAIGAKPILSIIYGAQYEAVAVPFALLCFAMFFYLQAVILSQIYMAIGMPHLQRQYVILLAATIICLIYPGTKLYGLVGASGVVLLSNAVAVFMQIVWLKNIIGLKFKDYIFCWWPFPTSCSVGINTDLESD